jgi:hypothetical protein
MTPEAVQKKAQELINQLGLSPDVTGIADEKIGYSNYQRIMGQYQQILNDTLVLVRELAKSQQGAA